MYKYALLLHLLCATIWTGGHLVLATTVLPRALRARDPRILQDFEQGFERIGMPALLLQILTGLYMAHTLLPPSQWLDSHLVAHLIQIKLGLLLLTLLTALDARFRVIPHLSAATLPAMGRRIAFVTTLSVLFVVTGLSFRGWLGM